MYFKLRLQYVLRVMYRAHDFEEEQCVEGNAWYIRRQQSLPQLQCRLGWMRPTRDVGRYRGLSLGTTRVVSFLSYNAQAGYLAKQMTVCVVVL
jgi:hypothetical protein